MRAAGRDIAVDGFSRPYVRRSPTDRRSTASRRSCWRSLPPGGPSAGRALSSGLVVWAGTPLLFYMYVAPPFSHAVLGVRGRALRHGVAPRAALVVAARRGRAGLAGALMAMVREQDIFFALAVVADFGLRRFVRTRGTRRNETTPRRPRWPGAPRLPPATCRSCSPITRSTDSPGLRRSSRGRCTWYAPHALQVLADTEHGFFSGLRWRCSRSPD